MSLVEQPKQCENKCTFLMSFQCQKALFVIVLAFISVVTNFKIDKGRSNGCLW